MPKGKNPKADDDDLSDLDGLDISGGAANPMAADPTGMIAKMTDPAAVQKKMKKLAGSDEQLLKYIPAIYAAGLSPQECQVRPCFIASGWGH